MNTKKSVSKMQKSSLLRAGLGLCVILLAAGSSVAQTNSNSPIQVSANEIDVQPQNNLAIFSGNAEVVQDGSVIRASRFRVLYRGQGGEGGKIDKVISDGETFYVTPTEKVRGDKAVFDATNNLIIFSGNVILSQGQNVVTGEELRVNTISKQSIMKSSNGRVRAVFFPSQEAKKQ